jgi:CHAD domain-containing protein
MNSEHSALVVRRLTPNVQIARIQLLRIIGLVDGRLRRLVRGPGISEKGLHNLHRELRRIRAWLRPWRGVPRPGERELYRAIDRDLRAFARACGEVRDLDVAGSLLRRDTRGVKREVLKWHRIGLASAAGHGRRRLRKLAKVLLQGHRLRALAGLISKAPAARLQPKWASSLTLAKQRFQVRAGSALRHLRHRPSVGALHQLRKSVRCIRLLDEAGRRERAGTSQPALQRLLSRIGELHDLDLLLRRISRRKGSKVDHSLIARLSELRSSAQQGALTDLDDPRVVAELQACDRSAGRDMRFSHMSSSRE